MVHDNIIIGEGFTSPYGGNHAEVNAINSVKNKELLKESTIYVTLEPCSHFGKTPPCADLIVKHQIKNVIIGCLDTNSLVAGKGIERLQNAGINVLVGVLEEECLEHHKHFFTTQNKKRPYIILKWAETKDGLIYPELDSGSKKDEMIKQVQHRKPVWISNQYSQQLVHKWRAEEHAILVGTKTVIADNPSLNVRSWDGENPIRIVLDSKLRVSKNSNVFDGTVKTIVLTETKDKNQELQENVVFEEIDFSKNIAQQICEVLQKHKIQSVIIEGGSQTLQTFINENIWDEARIFIGNVKFEKGVKAPIFSAKISSEEKIKTDILRTYFND